MEQLVTLLSSSTLLALLPFVFIAIFMGLLMYYAHKSSDSKFNLYDTLIDSATGKASIERIAAWTALFSTTWWFLDGSIKGTMGWEGMLAYAGALGLTKVLTDFVKAKYKTNE